VSATDRFPVALGDEVVLDLTTSADAADAFALVDSERDRLREWLPWIDATVDLAAEREFLETVELANRNGAGLHATIRVAGEFAGLVGLRLDATDDSAEVGYWLGQHWVGRGVMTRSVAAMIDLAFEEFEVARVRLLAATGNLRSRAVAERLAMTLDGVRPDGEELARGFVDLAAYSISESDWPGAASI
jgi:ribosomal-protein-serine acetyltransferase